MKPFQINGFQSYKKSLRLNKMDSVKKLKKSLVEQTPKEINFK